MAEEQLPENLVEQIEFEIRKFGAFSRIHPDVFSKAPNFAWADPLIRAWSIGFVAHVPVHEIASARWPKTWWDAFKLRWFPRWALKKWPAEYGSIVALQLMDFGKLPVGRQRSYTVQFLSKTAGFTLLKDERLTPVRSAPLDFECPNCKHIFWIKDGLFAAEHAKPEGV